MIHFFPTFSKNAADTEFGRALRRLGVEHRIFASSVRLHYRMRIALFLVGIPRLAFSALRSAAASLVLARPVPDFAVVGGDIGVLLYALVRFIVRRRTRIVLGSFIFTRRNSNWANRARETYYRFVLSFVDTAIVHSRLEVARYQEIFSGLAVTFRFVPWGTTIDNRAELLAEHHDAQGEDIHIVSAGRSGRDYATLFRALESQDISLRVICDYLHERPNPTIAERVTILSSTYGKEYLRELIRGAVVVVPLAVDDISAGQMVVIQSMGLGKAVIVTDTPTIRDYVTDGHDARLVPMGDADAMRAAIADLLSNPAKRARLGTNAMATFDVRLSTEGTLRGLLSAIGVAVDQSGARLAEVNAVSHMNE